MRVRDIPPRLPGKTRTRPERVADAAAYEMKLRLEKGFTPEAIGFRQMTAEELIKLGGAHTTTKCSSWRMKRTSSDGERKLQNELQNADCRTS